MRIAHLQPTSGIAGNMLIGACLDAGLPWPDLARVLEPLAVGDWRPVIEPVIRCGLRATYFNVDADDPPYRSADHSAHHGHDAGDHHPHHHGPSRRYPEVVDLVDRATHLSERVKRGTLEALARIGDAESRLHGVPLAELHLHEIGAIDTIIDVVGTLAALELLGVERVYADPVHTGTGHVATAHGIVPNPTPATRAIFGDFPLVPTAVGKELATPTGAALLVTLVRMSETWGATPPAHKAIATGYGAGGWDLPDRPNVLAITIGESVDHASVERRWDIGRVSVLTTNVDDLSPERFPPLVAQLLEHGAFDVALFPCTMKGGRPGVQLEALCDPSRTDELAELLFRAGATLGIRVQTVGRFCLDRRTEEVVLAEGDRVQMKVGFMDGEPVWRKPEFREVAAAAERSGRSIPEVLDEISAAQLPPWAMQS